MRTLATKACAALAVCAAILLPAQAGGIASAAPSVSPFAGTYWGAIPGSAAGWTIVVSSSGKFSADLTPYFIFVSGSAGGSIQDDGRLSGRGTESYYTYYWGDGEPVVEPKKSPKPPDSILTRHFRCEGVVAIDPDGNLRVTAPDGTVYVWWRS